MRDHPSPPDPDRSEPDQSEPDQPEPERSEKDREREKRNEWLRLAAIGPHFLASTLIGFGIGYKIDQWTGKEALWTVIGALLGIAAGFLNLFRELTLVNEAEERDRREQEIMRGRDKGSMTKDEENKT